MLQSLQNYYADQYIYLNLPGLNSGGTVFSPIISNHALGWEKVRFTIRFRTGAGVSSTGTVRFVFRTGVDGYNFDSDTFGAQARSFVVNESNTNFTIGWSPNLDLAGPYWIFQLINNTGATFSEDATFFSSHYVAAKHMLVDRFDFFYKASGKVCFAGDATETRFPFVTEMIGGLRITGVIRDFAFLPAGKLLRNRISGLASVQTFPLPATEGKMGFTGTFGGPTANP